MVPSTSRPGPVSLEVVEGGDDVEVGAVAAAAALLLVVQEPAADVDEGVGAPLGGATGGFALHIAGGGQAQGGGDDGAALGVEAAGQFAAAVEDAGQVQRPFWQHRFGVVAHHGVGPSGPVLHRDRGVVYRQRRQFGDQFGLVVGEQADGAVREVGDDGLDLPARQDTVSVGAGGDRQLP